uniref:Major centromere autoantigen B n=1 Tax=Caligus clemensi TaxID=344056 RepID=C1C1N1_CALCM|nr:Major centromere autoantigen B [Caligus clemensi]
MGCLESYLLDERLADGQIVAQGRRFPIHRSLLAIISPFLASHLWTSDLIVLPEIRDETLEAFLRLLYLGFTGNINPETHYELSVFLRSIHATRILDVPPLKRLKPRKDNKKIPSAQITKRPPSLEEEPELNSKSIVALKEEEAFPNEMEIDTFQKSKHWNLEYMSNKRKLVTKTYQEKYDIIKFYDAHPEMKKIELARMFGLPRGTLSEILKSRHMIIDTVASSVTMKPLCKRVKAIHYERVDSALISWYHQEILIRDGKLSREVLLQKARNLATEFGVVDANRISLSWIERFKSRHRLTKPYKTLVSMVEEEKDALK